MFKISNMKITLYMLTESFGLSEPQLPVNHSLSSADIISVRICVYLWVCVHSCTRELCIIELP